jgi:hypothetical protein
VNGFSVLEGSQCKCFNLVNTGKHIIIIIYDFSCGNSYMNICFFTKFHRDEIYNYNGRAVSFRGIFESLYSRTYIHSGVLDAWCDYLNENEKERDVMNSPFRLFMKPDIVSTYSFMI